MDNMRQLHLRESYQRLQDLTEQYDKEISALYKEFLRACERMNISADAFPERPTDSLWQHYGLIPFSLLKEQQTIEEEFDALLRDISAWTTSSIPRSSRLSVSMRALDTEDQGNTIGAHLFYKIMAAQKHQFVRSS